ncbi:MAG TPA: hypothetical protein VF148_18275 [Acidimicrobiia bacterium]
MRIRSSLLVTVALATVFALVLPVSAKSDRIPFQADDVLYHYLDPGDTWDSAKFNHVRGLVAVYDTYSDNPLYDGVTTVAINWNAIAPPVFDEGRMWGTFELVLDDYDGGYTGTWVAEVTGDQRVWVGHGLGHGYGEVDGYKVRFDLAWTPTGDTVSGYVLTPGNK